jgi:hypothetical protein
MDSGLIAELVIGRRRAPTGWRCPGMTVSARPRQPDGQITGLSSEVPVQPLLKKYSDFQKSQIALYPPPSRPTRGALAIVTDAGRDAVDASGATDESAWLADGQVVWS